MYLTAQRVRSPRTGDEGVNAFHYSHGGLDWLDQPVPRPLPEQDPGELRAQRIVVPPPGNHVLSYFDIVTPDTTSNSQITEALRHLLDAAESLGPFPWSRDAGRCLFRFGLEQAMLSRWNWELAELFRAALLVRQSLSGRAPCCPPRRLVQPS